MTPAHLMKASSVVQVVRDDLARAGEPELVAECGRLLNAIANRVRQEQAKAGLR